MIDLEYYKSNSANEITNQRNVWKNITYYDFIASKFIGQLNTLDRPI